MKRIVACLSFLLLVACGDDTYNYELPADIAPPPGLPVVEKPVPAPAVTPAPAIEVAPPSAPECVSPRRCKDDEDKPKCC